MDQLIPIINKLQDVLTTVQLPQLISLPQIVVVGAQSSGKSSVLESIVGKDFLPRGSGIVTRSPLLLQLVHIDSEEDWGEFLHAPDKKFTDFQEIRLEIENYTKNLAGDNKGISDKPINLRIYSHRVLDITLVDLPGITKVPVGDQPPDIEIKIRNLIMSYIENPSSIILAITSANADLANSDALKLAREVDPNGERTLGVLTKLDLMDEGTDAVDMLKGNVYPLKLGYIGVVCRSQADINKNKLIEKHLRDEYTFFKNHPSYSSFIMKMGIPFLAKRLNAVLMNHISATLPQLKKNVSELLYSVQEELNSYGDTLSGNRDLQSMILLQVIDRFAQGFDDALEGRSTTNSTDELQGGSRINFIFEEIYRRTLYQIDPFERMTDQDIRTAIRNASGTRSSLFVPSEAFENLVRRQIIKLKEPSLQCMQYIYEELSNNIYRVDIPELKRFDNLKEELCQVVRELLNRRLIPTNEMIEKLIEVEYCYINTHHPDFMGGNEALQVAQNELEVKTTKPIPTEESKVSQPLVPEKKKVESKPKPKTANAGLSGWLFGGPKVIYIQKDTSRENGAVARPFHDFEKETSSIRLPAPPVLMKASIEPSNKELLETTMVKKLIESYFNIVRKTVGDLVPKTIMAFLVQHSKKEVHRELVKQLYREDRFDSLLQEANDLPQKRGKCVRIVNNLKRANNILNEIREFRISD